MSSERSSLSSSCSELNQPVNDDDFSRSLLKKASTKYPSFISSSSFIGQITAIDSKPIGHAATIWLSESPMLSFSLLPGSLVSVSLAASSKTFSNGASPLESLQDECAGHFRIGIGHNNGSNMGSFFAVAVVFPSCKIHHDADYTGVLLHGPPGTGQTSLAWSCAHDVGVKLFIVNGPDVFSEDYGKSELELYGVFDEAKQVAPALVFIDELDAIAPTRKDGSEHLSQRMVVTLLKLMDEIKTTAVLVIAATNRPDSVDPALRRHG